MRTTLRDVVVAMLAVGLLAAAAAPAWQAVKQEATLSGCQANLAAVHNVMMLYAQNNGGRFPPCDTYYGDKFTIGATTPITSIPAVEELKSYGADADMFFCPFDPIYGTDNWMIRTWDVPSVSGLPGRYTASTYIGYTLFIDRGGPYGASFTDGRAVPETMNDDGDLPMVADILHYRSLSFKNGWYHGGGPVDGLFNSSCNTLFMDGHVGFLDWPAMLAQGPGLVHGAARDQWYFALRKPLAVDAALSGDWVYQNTPETTGGRHLRTLTFQISGDPLGNTSYDVDVIGDDDFAVVVAEGGEPDTAVLQGGLRLAAPTGPVTVNVVARGLQHDNFGSVTKTITVRPLGDINGDGVVDAQDKLVINQELNGIAHGRAAEELDLDANEVIDAADKLILNQDLNGLPVP